eukprot:8538480-Alexandrium_andersonii.AAC.1
MANRYRRTPLASFDHHLSDASRLSLWRELFFPTFLESLHAADAPACAHPHVLHALLLPDCGLARGYLMFARHYNIMHPGVAADVFIEHP